MIHSSEFQNMNLSERFFCLADSYLDAAAVLGEAMTRDKYRKNFSNSRVLLHPVHHAFELFFKDANSSQQFAIPKHHNLIALYNCYHECFKDPTFAFAIPFGLDDDSPFRVGEEFFKNLDELYRYTVDNRRFHTGNVPS
jgi:hypothetical protein